MPITFNLESGRLAGLLSRTKSSAADVTEAARASVSTLSTKATETIACAKLRMAIADLNDEIDLQMRAIGELVYATHKGNPSPSEEMQKILDYVDGLYEEIEGHEQELKTMRGIRFCPVCSAENASTNVYCQDCGQPLPITRGHQE